MDPSALGRYLRESREARELTLEDAVRALRIRRDILEAFEQGEFNVMDSTVRVRGMLRNYAHYLGLEEERVLQYYESSTNSKRRRRFGRRETHVEPIAPRKITDTPPSLPAVTVIQSTNNRSTVDLLRYIAMFLVSVAALAVIIFVLVDTLELNLPDETLAIVPTVAAGSATVTPTNTATITPRATIPTDTPDAASLNIVGIQVILEIQQRSWLRILVDDREIYTGILEPGFSSTYTGNENVAITAANAAALEITYNGVMQDPFGARGQEVELIFTATGINVVQSDGQSVATAIPFATIITQIDDTVSESQAPSTQALSTEEVMASLTATDENGQVSATSPVPGIITPTPLFSVDEGSPASVSASSVEFTASPVIATSAPLATNVPQATLEPTLTDAPTSAAVLPRRETPSNPTATKTG